MLLKVMGIVNGTTNYILTKMDENGAAFADALKEAQKLGFAEADPTADIEGFDAAAKAAILAGLAFHSRVTDNDVYKEGISKISAADVKVAKAMEMVIKLLAIAECHPRRCNCSSSSSSIDLTLSSTGFSRESLMQFLWRPNLLVR
jgi:homoserine dehydrogenase